MTGFLLHLLAIKGDSTYFGVTSKSNEFLTPQEKLELAMRDPFCSTSTAKSTVIQVFDVFKTQLNFPSQYFVVMLILIDRICTMTKQSNKSSFVKSTLEIMQSNEGLTLCTSNVHR